MRIGPTGYTPCEYAFKINAALRASLRLAQHSRSNLRSLAHKQACRLVSLDYISVALTNWANGPNKYLIFYKWNAHRTDTANRILGHFSIIAKIYG